MTTHNILDAGSASTLAEVDGLNTLTAGTGRVVIIQQVLDELASNSRFTFDEGTSGDVLAARWDAA